MNLTDEVFHYLSGNPIAGPFFSAEDEGNFGEPIMKRSKLEEDDGELTRFVSQTYQSMFVLSFVKISII